MCEEMSLAELFDDIIKIQDVLVDGSEQEFIRFALKQEECRLQWLASVEECIKLKKALSDSQKQVSSLESKLQCARRLIDTERKRSRALYVEKRNLDTRLSSLQSSSMSYKEKLPIDADIVLLHPNSKGRSSGGSSDGGRKRSSIFETTGSIISELSCSRTEDDLNSSHMLSGNTLKKMRPSLGSQYDRHRPSSGSFHRIQMLENLSGNDADPVTAADVTLEDPALVKSIIEESRKENFYGGGLPSKSPKMRRSTSLLNVSDGTSSLKSRSRHSNGRWFPPDLGINFEVTKKINSRQHCFTQKIVIKLEDCNPCGKRIKFGKMAIKCVDCKVVSHPECKDKIVLPCISIGSTTKKRTGQKGSIADYVPLTCPMVPSIVIHCVNEVEARGLSEVGVYRIPGSDKKVKRLKEKFLLGKGAPNLSEYDIHVVCSVLKDFLLNLNEPLITHSLWSDFARAATTSDPRDSMACMTLYQAISELPKPNQDTLAYLILHFQKVASCRECKMPMENLVKVFGPSISGNSSFNMSPKSMHGETDVQQKIIESLMRIPSEYWASFINKDSDTPCTSQSKGLALPFAHSKTLLTGKTFSVAKTPSSMKTPPSEKTPTTVKENKKWKSNKFFQADGVVETPHINRWKAMRFFSSPK